MKEKNPERVWLTLRNTSYVQDSGRKRCTEQTNGVSCSEHICHKCLHTEDDFFYNARHEVGVDTCENLEEYAEQDYNCSCWNDFEYVIPDGLDLSNYRENWTIYIAMDPEPGKHAIEYTLFSRENATEPWTVVQNLGGTERVHYRCDNTTTCIAEVNDHFAKHNNSFVVYDHYQEKDQSEVDQRNTRLQGRLREYWDSVHCANEDDFCECEG